MFLEKYWLSDFEGRVLRSIADDRKNGNLFQNRSQEAALSLCVVQWRDSFAQQFVFISFFCCRMTATPVLLPEQGETLSSSSGGKAVASTNTESNNPPPKPRYRYTKEEMYALANSPAAKICPPDIPPYLIRGEPGNSAELRSESAPGDSGRRRSLAQVSIV
jgi:hypothetical protein